MKWQKRSGGNWSRVFPEDLSIHHAARVANKITELVLQDLAVKVFAT
jgi:hypothetical protein